MSCLHFFLLGRRHYPLCTQKNANNCSYPLFEAVGNALVIRYANRNSRRVYIRQHTIGYTNSVGELYTREHLLTCSLNNYF